MSALQKLLMQQLGADPSASPDDLLRRVAPYLRSLALEYGATGCSIRPHDPADPPQTHRATIAIGGVDEFDAEGALGKPATRGHVVNNGDEDLIVDWQPYHRNAFEGNYQLAPGAALDMSSWIWRKLRVTAAAGGTYQALAQ